MDRQREKEPGFHRLGSEAGKEDRKARNEKREWSAKEEREKGGPRLPASK